MFHFIASFYNQRYFIVRTMFANLLGKGCRSCDFYTINLGDNIALTKSCFRSRTSLRNACDIDTTDLFNAGILAELVDKILVDVAVRNTEQCTLHDTILTQIINHLTHNAFRHRKRVADITSCRGFDNGIDTHQLATSIYQRTARISRIYRSIGLDKRLDTEFVRDNIELARLCAYYTCRDSRLQVKWRAYCQHPFAKSQIVRRAKLQNRQLLRLNLDKCNIGSWVFTYDFCIEDTTIIEFNAQLRSTINNMVVSYDIAICRDNHTRATRLLLTFLWLTVTLLWLRKAKKLKKWIVRHHTLLTHLNLCYRLDIHHRLNGIFGCKG